MNHGGKGKNLQVFLSYACQDSLGIAQPLYEALKKAGLEVWFDSQELQLGDQLTPSICQAIEETCYGVVILSEKYFEKKWTQMELAELDKKQKRILPVWHGVSSQDFPAQWKPIADKAALNTWTPLKELAEAIVKTVNGGEPELPRIQPAHVFWNLPSATPLFSGRNKILQDIEAALSSARIAVLEGLDGVGKTEIARKFCRDKAYGWEFAWWLRVMPNGALGDQLDALAQHIGLPEAGGRDLEKTTDAVTKWLTDNVGWLLVFDDVLSVEHIKRFYQGTHPTGKILVTSPGGDWNAIGAKPITVGPFTLQESSEFLQKRVSPERFQGHAELARALGGLPLALEQAGAYVEEARLACQGYLRKFLANQGKMLEQSSHEGQRTVSATVGMALERIREMDRDGGSGEALIRACSFLSPARIPRSLFDNDSRLFKDWGEPSPKDFAWIDDIDLAVAKLARFSLVEGQDAYLHIHGLVQAVTRYELERNSRNCEKHLKAILRRLDAAFPGNVEDPGNWPGCSILAPHCLAAAEHADAYKTMDPVAARILNRAGIYLHARGERWRAREVLRRSAEMAGAAHLPFDPQLATYFDDLAQSEQEMDNLQEARELLYQAYSIAATAFGEDSLQVAPHLNKLGMILEAVGDLKGARQQFERAVQICRKSPHGEPQLADYLNNLGGVLEHMGELNEAKWCFKQAFDLDKRHGLNDIRVARDLQHLASILLKSGSAGEARQNLEQALAISQRDLDENHPDVAVILNSLGAACESDGNLARAKDCYERALRIDEAVFGERHSSVAVQLASLAKLMERAGSETNNHGLFENALAFYTRALDIDEVVFGRSHERIATRRHDISRVLLALGRRTEARRELREALRVSRKTVGDGHPLTLAILSTRQKMTQWNTQAATYHGSNEAPSPVLG